RRPTGPSSGPAAAYVTHRRGFSRRDDSMATPWQSGPNRSSNVGCNPALLPLASPGTRYHIWPRSVNHRAAPVFGNGHRAIESPARAFSSFPIMRFRLRIDLRRLCEKFLEEGVEWLTWGIRAG